MPRPDIRVYFCSCPDFVKSQRSVLLAEQLSLSYDRGWEDSLAGKKTFCKHIYATKLYLQDPDLGLIRDVRVRPPGYETGSKGFG